MDNDPAQPNRAPSMPSELPYAQGTSASPQVPKPSQQIPTWMVAAAVVVFGLLVLVGIATLTQKPTVVALPTPTPAITTTPTPIRTLSPFATTSAFRTLDTAVATYAGDVKAYNNNDPSLSPPVLDLNLGF